ncbi:gtp-binding family protein, partial [Cystoisospora suis]
MGGGGKHRKGHSHRGSSSLGTSGFGRALLQQRLLAHEEQKRHLASLLHKDSQEERNSLSQIGFLEDGEGELEAPVGHPRHQGNEDGRKTLHEKVFSSCSPSSSSFHRAVGLSSSLSKHHLLEFLQSRSSSSSFPSQGGGRGSIRRKDLKSLTEQNELDHYLTTVLASQEKYFQTRGEAKLSPQEDSACIPILVKKSHGLREGEQDSSSSSLSYQTRLVLDGDERLYLQGKTEEKEKEEIPIPRRPFQFPVSWFFFNEKKRGEDEEEEEGEGEKKKTERGEEEIMKRRRKREEERL